MVYKAVTSHSAILVLLKTDVHAELGLESINESLYALAVFIAQRFAVIVEYLSDVGIEFSPDGLFSLAF